MHVSAINSLPPFTSSLLICFSHLRWDFVFQRPQHLLTRARNNFDILYMEEPVFENVDDVEAKINIIAPGLTVITPILPIEIDESFRTNLQRGLLDQLLQYAQPSQLLTWYYTPMAVAFSAHLRPAICVYDCMDELSGFKNAPEGLQSLEAQLFSIADLVFTGGESLFQAKRPLHDRVYAFPSSIDVDHFGKARGPIDEPVDQISIPHPRVGFFGVIDERMDLELVAGAVSQMPECQFVMLGPTAKIDPSTLPQAPNLHWLGNKPYGALPSYLSHWSAGWMPFALNEATRFISPTKTPEFLAAGVPVVSTAIADVVTPYGAMNLAEIASLDDVEEKLRRAMSKRGDVLWIKKVDAFLAHTSWDKTWGEMLEHISTVGAIQNRPMQRGA